MEVLPIATRNVAEGVGPGETRTIETGKAAEPGVLEPTRWTSISDTRKIERVFGRAGGGGAGGPPQRNLWSSHCLTRDGEFDVP